MWIKREVNNMPSNSLKISVSGIRAIVGDTLTPGIIMDFAHAFGTYLKKGSRVVLGRDSRVSGPAVRQAVIAGLLASGCEIIDIGILPIPSAHVMVKKLKADGGVVLTASHNPVEWNALKFINAEGIVLPGAAAKEVVDIYHSRAFRNVGPADIKGVTEVTNAIDTHIEEVLKNIPVEIIKKKKFKVVVDCCNGGAGIMSPKFLKLLGCEVIGLNLTTDGIFPHHPEPLDHNLTQLKIAVIKEKADIGFAQDADADRLGIVDEKGSFIGEELTLALAAMYALPNFKTPLVTNLSSSAILDWVAKISGVEIYRSKVGEANVVELMKKVKSKMAGEGGGKVIFPPVTVSADSISAMGLVLALLAATGKSVSRIMGEMPKFHQIKHKVELGNTNPYHILRKMKAALKAENLNTEDGLKILRSYGWAHIRPSNTEPIIRIIVETEDAAKSQAMLDEMIGILNK